MLLLLSGLSKVGDAVIGFGSEGVCREFVVQDVYIYIYIYIYMYIYIYIYMYIYIYIYIYVKEMFRSP